MLGETHCEILHRISLRLEKVKEPWAITGSCGMALQGMALEVHDIDLQTTTAGAYQIQEALGGNILLPLTYKPSERIRSLFGALEMEGARIEIMGDMEKRLPDGSWENPPNLDTIRTWVIFQDRRFPVLPLEYEAAAYQLMGREERARQIATHIRQTRMKPV